MSEKSESKNQDSVDKKFRLRSLVDTTPRKAIAIGAGAAAIAALVFGGFKAGELFSNSPDETPTAPSSQEAVPTPAAAKDFIKTFGSRYADPLPAYYAETAYEKEFPGQFNMVSDDYVDSYNPEATVSADVSPLGFQLLRLPLSAEINKQTSVDQFNASIGSMDTLMNALAKNPTPQEISVITDEFITYSGFHNQNAQKLVNTLSAIVQKYGSGSNYSINKATAEGSDTATATLFNGQETPLIDGTNADGGVTAFNNVISLSINVDSYSNTGKKTSSTDVVNNLQFSVVRATDNFDPLHGGYIGIGIE